MKSSLIVFALLFLGIFSQAHFASASFDRDLYFGLSQDDDVKALQGFLTEQNLYDGPISGNYFALTKKAVAAYQQQQGLLPASGFFGPQTREHVNKLTPGVTTQSSQEAQEVQDIANARTAISETEIAVSSLSNSVNNLSNSTSLLEQQLRDLVTNNDLQQTQLDSITASFDAVNKTIADIVNRLTTLENTQIEYIPVQTSPETMVVPTTSVDAATSVVPTTAPTRAIVVPRRESERAKPSNSEVKSSSGNSASSNSGGAKSSGSSGGSSSDGGNKKGK